MKSDEDLYTIHYYLEKGHSIKDLSSLTHLEMMFLKASMYLTSEEVNENGKS